ncbi:MAG TPA: glycosyltransferase [Anaerolineae bacterium]|nr:glycosyltransferase [Anaerolineae bacterium]
MIRRVAMLSVHTCPLATLGGKEAGGMNVYVRDLAREFSRRGVYVDVFTRSQNPDIPRINRKLGDCGRVIHVPAGPEAPYDKNLVADHLPEFVAGVRAFARREGLHYDVIHSHYWLSGLAAIELREVWGTPVVQMFHTLGHMKNSVANGPQEWESERRIAGEARVMAEADRLIAATPLERAQMVWLYGAEASRIVVVPPGVDLQLFHPVPEEEAKRMLGQPAPRRIILFVGRIEPLKGIETLLRAMALVAPQVPHWQEDLSVIVIGGAPGAGVDKVHAELERLRRLRAELGIEDLVTFHGAEDQDTLVYYYSAAEMVVVPSHYESFGMVALEAMACGTPVVASRVGGLAFNVQDGETGFLVPDGDPHALAERILVLLHDRGLRQRLGARAAQWANRYSWAAVADQLEVVYESVQPAAQVIARACCG